jgi:hypothetical protein
VRLHAYIHVEYMCNKYDHPTRLSTPLEFSNEGKETNTYDGQFASSLGHEEEVAYSPCNEVYGGLGVSTPECIEELELGELPLGNDIISQEVCMTEDQSSSKYFRECSFVESTLDVRSSSDNFYN